MGFLPLETVGFRRNVPADPPCNWPTLSVRFFPFRVSNPNRVIITKGILAKEEFMKKKTVKKLTLHRETLRFLEPSSLKDAQGATSAPWTTGTMQCPTTSNEPCPKEQIGTTSNQN